MDMKDTQKQRIVARIEDGYGAQGEHLWEKDPSDSGFRPPGSGKGFALLMEVPRNTVGLEGDAPGWVLDVKCGPILSASLPGEKGYASARYMSRATWVSIVLDGTLPDERVDFLLGISYDAAAPKRKAKKPEKDKNDA